jgi:hypothetical protein
MTAMRNERIVLTPEVLGEYDFLPVKVNGRLRYSCGWMYLEVLSSGTYYIPICDTMQMVKYLHQLQSIARLFGKELNKEASGKYNLIWPENI